MKATKLFLSSLILAGMFSACTKENFTEVPVGDAQLAARPQVNLTISSPVETRFTFNGESVKMTENDELGAVLVDYAKLWTVADGHRGNNKWAYDKATGKFVTEGTTAVGSWLFYTSYKEEMTKTGEGVKTLFPQVQEGSADWKWLANNNVNFLISPIIQIDGYEGKHMDLNVPTMSIYNYLNIKLKFEDQVTKVEKIIVNATKGGNEVGNYLWPAKYLVNNTALEVADVREDSMTDLNADKKVDEVDQQIAINKAFYAMQNVTFDPAKQLSDNIVWTKYDVLANVTADGEAGSFEYLVLDCDSNHADTNDSNVVDFSNGEFSTWMLMPAGEYESITLTIYTDKGVYTKTVADRNAYRLNMDEKKAPAVAGERKVYLRNNVRVNLANVEKVKDVEDYDYIYVAKKDATNVEDGNIITKTSDLIEFINGIQKKGNYNVDIKLQKEFGNDDRGNDALAAHTLVINQDVMDAVEAKEAELGGDIQLTLTMDTEKELIKVAGNTDSELDLHDFTFQTESEVISGNVEVSSDFEANADLTVRAGADVDVVTSGVVTKAAAPAKSYFVKVIVEKDAKFYVSASHTTINRMANYGHVGIREAAEIKVTKNISNYGTFTMNGAVEVPTFTNFENASLKNNKKYLTVDNFTNDGSVENSAVVNIKDASENTAKGVITNKAKAKFIVNSTKESGAVFTNKGTFNNDGQLYTHSVNENVTNHIHNLGTINANAGSQTFITKNSLSNETTVPTNDPRQVMGTINLEERDAECTVSEDYFEGYIVYNVVAADLTDGVFAMAQNDKLNKITFSIPVTVGCESKLKYVVAGADFAIAASSRMSILELAFVADATFKPGIWGVGAEQCAEVSLLEVRPNVVVTVPVGQNFEQVTKTKNLSKTVAMMNNYGEIMLGGVLATNLTKEEALATSVLVVDDVEYKGIFSSAAGDGKSYIWGSKVK